MAILKQFTTNVTPPAVNYHEFICISDDDCNASSDSDDECEFEDVLPVNTTANMAKHTESRFDEAETTHDDKATHDEASEDAESDNGATRSFTPWGGSAYEVDDDHIVTATTPHNDAAVGRDDDEASSTEAFNLQRHDDVNAACAPNVTVDTAMSWEDMVAELADLRGRVTQLEADRHAESVACQAPSASKKRKPMTPVSPSAKRSKSDRIVRISARRVYVYWNGTSERCEYTWRRGRGGHCWVGGDDVGKREEVDGEYLLCCASTMAVEIRANADWLPIEVQFNERKNVFEGQASVGSRRLEIQGSVMMDMMRGGSGEHVASVFY